MATSPDSFPDCSPDSGRPTTGSLDSPGALDAFAVSLGAAVDLFIAAKAAEGASERTLEWYRMITGRAVRRFGSDRPVDRISAAELRLRIRRASSQNARSTLRSPDWLGACGLTARSRARPFGREEPCQLPIVAAKKSSLGRSWKASPPSCWLYG